MSLSSITPANALEIFYVPLVNMLGVIFIALFQEKGWL